MLPYKIHVKQKFLSMRRFGHICLITMDSFPNMDVYIIIKECEKESSMDVNHKTIIECSTYLTVWFSN